MASNRESNQDKKMRSNAWAIWSFVLAMIPVPILIYYRLRGDLDGALELIVLLYSYWFIDLLRAVAAIVFAVIGLRSKMRWLSIVTLCIEIIVVLAILFFFVFRRDLL